jgi:hypothetical protein
MAFQPTNSFIGEVADFVQAIQQRRAGHTSGVGEPYSTRGSLAVVCVDDSH